MLFNSLKFAVFLPIVFILYWFVFDYAIAKCRYQLRLQNLFIVIASYIFYGWWDWRFLILIAFTSLCSYCSGLLIGKSRHPKMWMMLNVIINLAVLGIFKYYDFFVSSFARIIFNANADNILLNLILPVGISFYTFQALSYSIDVYRGKLSPTNDVIAFFAYISFFPQLVAGPIERATNLLPQFQRKRTFEYATAVDGMRQILWGLFKKIVVADSCAVYVDQVFSSYQYHTGATLLLASILFTFQIYGDFSGYSDIAIGTSKLFGIRLMRNFNIPYFSRDIAEFWRRWHISLTTWFRDYIYIPLGGSRPDIPVNVRHRVPYKKMIILRNTFIIFLISGFWHGANWTFLLWGIYHALLFVPLVLTGNNRKYLTPVATNQLPDGSIIKRMPSIGELLQMLVTFLLVVLGWIIFRSANLHELYHYMCQMATPSLFSIPWTLGRWHFLSTFLGILTVLTVEWLCRCDQNKVLLIKRSKLQWCVYIILGIIVIIHWSIHQTSQFIYFAF